MIHTFQNAKTSKQTTIGGVLTFVALLVAQAQNHFDGNTSTVVDWAVIAAGVGFLWTAMNARDAHKSTEESNPKT